MIGSRFSKAPPSARTFARVFACLDAGAFNAQLRADLHAPAPQPGVDPPVSGDAVGISNAFTMISFSSSLLLAAADSSLASYS